MTNIYYLYDMKSIASLIILSLLITSLKLVPAVQAMADMAFQTEANHSCCSSAKSACDTKADLSIEKSSESSHDTDKKDCCSDGDCHCLCCLHVVYCKSMGLESLTDDIFDESQYNWKFDYFKDFNFSIFHPPLV